MNQRVSLLFLLPIIFWPCFGFKEAARLYDDLMNRSGNINKILRPVANHSEPLIVFVGLRLSQLMDVDEKNQIITTNVWLDHEWKDAYMTWEPKDYGNVTMMNIPSEKIWRPDIVLDSNADGSYVVKILTKAKVFYDGTVKWSPPAVFKTSCQIDVEFFPFDIQECSMKFILWSSSEKTVILRHSYQRKMKNPASLARIDYAVDLRDFYPSVEFDILEIKAVSNSNLYSCCKYRFSDVTFSIVIRRKTLFYTINLMLPCIAISMLTLLVFYLPSQSGEKISLSINIMLSLTVFFLLLAEIVPPTGLVVPLIGKYLLFTIVIVVLSILVTVFVLNINNRNSGKMPWIIRRLFLSILPKILGMEPPLKSIKNKLEEPKNTFACHDEIQMKNFTKIYEVDGKEGRINHKVRHEINEFVNFSNNIRFIADHLKRLDEERSIHEDWKYVALVLDRFFLILFTVSCLTGCMGITLQAPTLYDNRVDLSSQDPPEFIHIEEHQTNELLKLRYADL